MRTALGVLRELHVVRRIGLDDVRRRERVRVVAFAQEVESWLMLGASPRATVRMARALTRLVRQYSSAGTAPGSGA